jgi:hypothetical protein
LHFDTGQNLTFSIGKEVTETLKAAYSISSHTNSLAYAYISPKRRTANGLLLYGRVFQDGRLEGLVCRIANPNQMYSISGVNWWNPTADTLSNVICPKQAANALRAKE